MSKFKRAHDFTISLSESTSDKSLYDFLVLITGDDELKAISGISKNLFVTQTRDYYAVHKKFTPKQKAGLVKTLKVYGDNLKRSGKI